MKIKVKGWVSLSSLRCQSIICDYKLLLHQVTKYWHHLSITEMQLKHSHIIKWQLYIMLEGKQESYQPKLVLQGREQHKCLTHHQGLLPCLTRFLWWQVMTKVMAHSLGCRFCRAKQKMPHGLAPLLEAVHRAHTFQGCQSLERIQHPEDNYSKKCHNWSYNNTLNNIWKDIFLP